MKKCNLRDLEKYCYYNNVNKYSVEVKYIFRGRFSSIEIFIMPDAICLEDLSGNCLTIQRVESIYRIDDSTFLVYSDYYGSQIETKIICQRE